MTWRDDAEREILGQPPGSSGLVDAAAELARLLELARGQLARRTDAPAGVGPEPDRLLTVEESAELLNVKPGWLYRNAGRLPFTRKLSPKMLRFSERGLRRYLATQRR